MSSIYGVDEPAANIGVAGKRVKAFFLGDDVIARKQFADRLNDFGLDGEVGLGEEIVGVAFGQDIERGPACIGLAGEYRLALEHFMYEIEFVHGNFRLFLGGTARGSDFSPDSIACLWGVVEASECIWG